MSRSTRRTSVVVNLLKVPNGFIVESDQKGNTIHIPKSFINQPKPKSKINYNQDSSQDYSVSKKKRQEHKLSEMQPSSQHSQQQNYTQWTPSNRQQQIPNPETLPISTTLEALAKSRQPIKYTLVIPSCAAWFSLETCHQTEKDALPEYFSSQRPSKTPEIYRRHRNFIVQLYRSNPQTYLSATACRRALAGDACGIARVHAFLQHWGIINFNVDPETCPGRIFPMPNAFYQPQDSLDSDVDDLSKDLSSSEALMVNSVKVLSKNYRPVCDYCGIICGLVWYQQKPLNLQNNIIKEIKLCVKCYSNGNFPSILSSEDFNKQNIEQLFERTDILQKLQKLEPKVQFTPDETVTLLTLIQEHPDWSWDALSEQMNETHNCKRSSEEMMLHYLQLPFKNISQLQRLVEDSDLDMQSYGYQEILQKLAQQEVIKYYLNYKIQPNIYSDQSNALNYHLEIFRKLLRRYDMKESRVEVNNMKEEERKQTNFIEELAEQSYAVKQLLDPKDDQLSIERLDNISVDHTLQLKQDTVERARQLAYKQEAKLQDSMQLMISIQMEKLELKLNYLEEYERLILYEKKSLELQQRAYLVDRLQIIHLKIQKE